MLGDIVALDGQESACTHMQANGLRIDTLGADAAQHVFREVKAGRKLTGLTATLRYYYDLEGHVPGGVYSAIPVFREQYENARNYARKMAQIAERNQNIDLDVLLFPRIVSWNRNKLP